MAIEMSFSKEQKKESLIDFVYNIIDSKIQYLNYQTKGITQPITTNNTSDDSTIGEANSDSFSLEEAEKLFLQFEVQSKQIKRLLLLRKLLNCQNSIVALALLTDNVLFEFEEHEITYILESVSYTHLTLPTIYSV